MAAPAKVNLVIYQGSTFNEVLRWESGVKVYKPITNITNSAPVRITAVGHDVPNGWRVKFSNILGMGELNNSTTHYSATVISEDIIEINEVNSIAYKAYISGGIIEYNEPANLAGYTARMQVRTKISDATVLTELTTENGGIILDNNLKTIVLNIPASTTTAFDWTTGVYSLELISSSGVVFTLLNGNITVKQEVTR